MQLLANIDVADLAGATDFYRSCFGLKVGRRLGSCVIELLGASSAIYLLEKPAGSAATATSLQRRDYSRHWTPVHLDFIVPDISAAVQRAQAAGALLEGELRTTKWGRMATFSDPWGHGFCLIEFLGRGYDEIADADSSA